MHWRRFFGPPGISSAEYRLPLLAKTDPPCSAVSLRQLSYLLVLMACVDCIQLVNVSLWTLIAYAFAFWQTL